MIHRGTLRIVMIFFFSRFKHTKCTCLPESNWYVCACCGALNRRRFHYCSRSFWYWWYPCDPNCAIKYSRPKSWEQWVPPTYSVTVVNLFRLIFENFIRIVFFSVYSWTAMNRPARSTMKTNPTFMPNLDCPAEMASSIILNTIVLLFRSACF